MLFFKTLPNNPRRVDNKLTGAKYSQKVANLNMMISTSFKKEGMMRILKLPKYKDL